MPVSYARLMEIAKAAVSSVIYDSQYNLDLGTQTYGSWESARDDGIAWAKEIGLDYEVVLMEYRHDQGFDEPEPYLTNRGGEKIFVGDHVVTIQENGMMLLHPTVSSLDVVDLFTPADELIVEEINMATRTLHLRHENKRYAYVQPRNLSPVCLTCHGLGFTDDDYQDDCPDCLGEGTPERNLK